MDVLESVGRLFYVVSPNKTMFQTAREVPNYVDGLAPDFALLFILEIVIGKLIKQKNVRVNDAIACLSQKILLDFVGLIVPGGQFALYVYLYSSYRLADLPWNSLYTWWISFLLVDLAYYWLHRAVHESNILWATHQVHHSSEDYNISTNVRQSILQPFALWIFYLPLALIMPPTMYLVHVQFNQIYQFWIHTETVRSLGPLEYILVTPSHHRVHHGANRSSIDKNFGGTLIIWDRIFGTFQPETEKIVYGVTEPVASFNPFRIQFDHCVQMWKAFVGHKNWKHKLSIVFKGPGWSVGKPWHGDPHDIPDKKYPTAKYDPSIPLELKLYLVFHFLILIQGYLNIMKHVNTPPVTVGVYTIVIYIIFSLVCIGMFLDKSELAPWMELLRCVCYFLVDLCLTFFTDFSLSAVHAKWIPGNMLNLTFATSLSFWAVFCCALYGRKTIPTLVYETAKKLKL